MSRQTLFDITDDILALDDLIHENEGNLDCPEVVEALEKFEAEIVNNMETKVDNYAAFIKMLSARSEVRKEEATRLMGRAKTDHNNAKAMADRLKMVFERLGIQKMDTPRYRVGVVNNGGAVPLFIDTPPANLPPEYRTEEVVVSANSSAIREALAAGTEVPGCRLGERGRRLAIK